jgi:hypothetical protein
MSECANLGMDGRCRCTTLGKASRRISHLEDDRVGSKRAETTQRAIPTQIGRSR